VLLLELGVLRLEALRGVAHFHRQAAGVLVRGVALARDGQVRRRVLERDARVGRELPRHGRHQQSHEPIPGAQGREREAPGGIVVRGGELQLRPHGPGRGARVVDDRDRVTYQLAHDVAGQRSGGGAAYRRGPPFVGVVLRLIERQRGRARRGRDDVERRTKAPTGGRFARWRVQGREQAPGLILHSLPPGEGRRHLIHAACDRAELLGLVLVESLVVAARGHALERPDDVGERGGESPPVVPEPDAERHEHDHEDHRRLYRRLYRVVADFGGELPHGGDLGLEGGGGRGTGQLLEALAELDHVGLRASCAPPDGDTVGQTGDGDGQKRRGEEPADARHGMGHATATNRERAAAGQERRPHETLAGGWGVL